VGSLPWFRLGDKCPLVCRVPSGICYRYRLPVSPLKRLCSLNQHLENAFLFISPILLDSRTGIRFLSPIVRRCFWAVQASSVRASSCWPTGKPAFTLGLARNRVSLRNSYAVPGSPINRASESSQVYNIGMATVRDPSFTADPYEIMGVFRGTRWNIFRRDVNAGKLL
jgi:hypothetical protein